MEIQFLQKINLPDGVRLSYKIADKKVYLEIAGTAMSSYDIYFLSDDELGMIFIPIITDIYDSLKEQGAELEKIEMLSDGLKVAGKVVYTKEEAEEVLKRKSKRLVSGEYWELVKVDNGDGKPYKIFNTHQKAFEKNGSYTPDFIDNFATGEEAINFLNKQ
jgi:hypothetical protein